MSDPTALPNFPPPPDEHPLRGRVLDVLIAAGAAPRLDDDGDIEFVVSEQKLFARCVDGELPMMRIFGQWRIDTGSGPDELTWLRAASTVSVTHNLVKVAVHGGVLLVAVDTMVAGKAPLDLLVGTAVQSVLAGVGGCHRQVQGGAGPGADPQPPDEASST